MRRVIDLSLPIHSGMKVYPSSWHPEVQVQQLGRHGVERRETRRLVLGTHTGTHVDAALHFIPEGESIDRVPLERFLGVARVLNLSPCRPLQVIDEGDLERGLGAEPGQRVVLRTDWSRHWEEPDYYTQHPYLSKEAARWLVQKGVRLLALDVPSPDRPCVGQPSDGEDSPNHKILLGNGISLVEYLCNLDQIRKEKVELVVLPLRLMGCDGSPARCVAIEE